MYRPYGRRFWLVSWQAYGRPTLFFQKKVPNSKKYKILKNMLSFKKNQSSVLWEIWHMILWSFSNNQCINPTKMELKKTTFLNSVGHMAGQLADGLLKNFAFRIHYLQNWCADDVKNSETPYVKLLTEQNFDFFVKKEYFFIFYIFWSLEFFSGKIMLAGLWPAKCPKKFFGNKK